LQRDQDAIGDSFFLGKNISELKAV
jgi:hypothetical protein